MAELTRRRAFALLTVCALTVPVFAQQKQPAVKQSALLKLAAPWPDEEVMAARRVEAEKRPLFADTVPFALTLNADFKVINKDRAVEGKKDYPGVLTVANDGGKVDTFNVKLRTRGHFRLRASSCSFVPLRVEFAKDETKHTIFDGQKTLKLITHCQSDREYEEYPRREYLAYRALNLLTAQSFRARLTTATYVQHTDNKPIITRLGLFLEDDDDVARRMEGRIMELPRAFFKDVEPHMLTLSMMYEYMIGSTDFSLYALHNVRLIRTQKNTTYMVPYDFDMTGLVNAIYAIPARELGIKTVRDRIYRGPCRTAEELEPVLELFRSKKAQILALYDTFPGLSDTYRREAKDYLNEFFRTLDRKGDVKRTFIDGQCSKKETM